MRIAVPSNWLRTAGVVCLGLLVVPAAARAALIVHYGFGVTGQETTSETSPAYSPTTVAANVTAAPVADPANAVGIEISSAATTPANAPFLRISPASGATTHDLALTNNSYYTFSVTPDSGYQLNLTDLTFNAARGGGSTPRGYIVRSSADGYAADLATADLLTTRPTYTPVSINLSGAAFQNLTGTLTFRVYCYSPSTGSSVDFDDIKINGDVSAVPEPGILALLAGGLVGLAFVRRRKT